MVCQILLSLIQLVYKMKYVLLSMSPWSLFLLRYSFPQATNQTLLDKFKRQHEGNSYIEFPAVMEPAFIIKHYAGKVKYGVKVRALHLLFQFYAFFSIKNGILLVNYSQYQRFNNVNTQKSELTMRWRDKKIETF